GIAYFSMEFGLGEALPLYAGGLGVLAGDYLKAASDLAVPVVGVGLLYHEGYFRQVINESGEQQEYYPYNDPTSIPVTPVQADDGAWMQVSIEFPGRVVQLRVWQARVGRLNLYLLDSNDPMNSASDRGITSKLYADGEETRLLQEIALGIGGWRLIDALGLPIDVCHLNEGHAAFVALERARCYMQAHRVDFHEALWATRVGNVFTTHTPVASAFDRFEPALLYKYGRLYAEQLGVEPMRLAAFGYSAEVTSDAGFNMAFLAMHACGAASAVSQLHATVSRDIFQCLFPRWPRVEVPVTYVTNGVHTPSWDSPWADKLWTHVAGKERWRASPEGLPGTVASGFDDAALWTMRGAQRAHLVDSARHRLERQWMQRGAESSEIERARAVLDPNALTIGFARRFAEYKRPALLLHDPDRLAVLLNNSQRPVQVVVAGKAHPNDAVGKRLIRRWLEFVSRPDVRARAVFLEDYDLALAQELVQGVDLWINTPRRPWEACGTSGMKVLVNGGLNLSELDGWWAEAYRPEVGWSLGDGQEHDEPAWDAIEAQQLYRLLEEEIVPLFYARDGRGVPLGWVERMRASMADLTPQYSATRMLRDYVEKLYLPAARMVHKRSRQDSRVARSLARWDKLLHQHWRNVHLGDLSVRSCREQWQFELPVYLAEIPPRGVRVQLYADGEPQPLCIDMQRGKAIPGERNGFLYAVTVPEDRPHTDFTPRVIPHHRAARIPMENNLILWWTGEVSIASPESDTHP
ncbi:MAG: alpha-glucan family phosphorylase, partial [Gammaproteobacteria bacterium]|nr:alpha-glucan family phosphorylase [Gammaproteobacteria bacterium]